MIEGEVIKCDCCGTQKLAEFVGDSLVIKDRRHGERHVAIIPVQAIIDKLKGQGYILIKPNNAAAEKVVSH